MYSSKYGAKAAFLASLAASSLASPVHRGHNDEQTANNLVVRGVDEINDVNSWCGLAEKLNIEANGEEALAGTTLGGSLEMFVTQINGNNANGWLGNFLRYVYRDDEMNIDSVMDCADLSSNCKVGKGETCKEAFETDDDWVKEAWWIFRGVQGAHAKMKKMRQALADKAIVETLKMQEMADDFETTMQEDTIESSHVPEWLSTVLGVGGTLLGMSKTAAANPGIGVALGLVSTAIDLTMPEEEEPEKLSLASIQSSLADVFMSSADGLDKIARIAVGRPWEDDDANLLPNPTNTNWDSPITNFYDHAFWLLDNDSEPVNKVITSTMELLRLHVVDSIIQSLGYAIIWDPEITSEADCSDSTRRWLNDVGGKDRCFYLAAKADANYVEAPADSDLVSKMSKWGVRSLVEYYQTSINCAKTTCKTVSATAAVGIGGEGDLPLCFYNAPVKKWDRREETGCNILDPLKPCQVNAVPDFVDDGHKTDCPA